MKVEYTQIIFGSPESRVAYSEAALEVKAREVAEIYEGLRVGASNGEFDLWSMDDLVHALHALGDELTFLDDARALARPKDASTGSKSSSPGGH